MLENPKLNTRSVLPIPEPTRPPITEIDVRNATTPTIFQVKAPEGAPNVLVILIDNLGYSASKTFGGNINIPTLERLAKDGLIYTNTHTAPLCSPSRAALLTGRNTHSAKTRHTVQYFEFQGNAGLYKDGWYANSLHKVAWEATPRAALGKGEQFLFNTAEDFSCAHNLIEKHPERFKEMWDTFLTEAVKYNVLPLDDRTYEQFNPAVAGRPDAMAGRTSLTVYEGMVGMKENSFINTKNQSYSVTAELVVPERGVGGVILAQGGHHAGWSLDVKDGRPQFAYNFLQQVTTINSPEPLPAGRVTVKYDFAYDGGKLGAGGTGTIFINGKQAASGRIDRTIPFLFGLETADVGMDLYTPVTNAYEKGNNRFTGKIEKVTIDLKRDRKGAEEMVLAKVEQEN